MDIVSYIMGMVASGGGGGGAATSVKSFTVNDDGSYTVVDGNDVEHTIEVTYDGDRISSIEYDDVTVNMTYDDDGNLVKIGNEDVDGMENVPNAALLNIVFSSTVPTDTSKLWVKCSEPDKIILDNKLSGDENFVSKGTTMLTKSNFGAIATYQKYIYVFGSGTYSSNPSTYLSIYRYNTDTEEWETMTTTIPNIDHYCSQYASTATVGSNIYLFGGFDSYNGLDSHICKVIKFNCITYACEIVNESLPTAYAVKSCAIPYGKYIYLIGGETNSRYSPGHAYITRYDTEENSFLQMNAVFKNASGATTGLMSPAAWLYEDTIYVFGGYNYYRGGCMSAIYKYDIVNDSITLCTTSMLVGLAYIQACGHGDNIYIIGGANDTSSEKIYKFNISNETYTELSDITIPNATVGLINTVVVGDVIYIFEENKSQYNLNIVSSLTKGILQISTSYGSVPHIDLISDTNIDMSIGINKVYLGNTENIAKEQEAYVYNTTTSSWQLI